MSLSVFVGMVVPLAASGEAGEERGEWWQLRGWSASRMQPPPPKLIRPADVANLGKSQGGPSAA